MFKTEPAGCFVLAQNTFATQSEAKILCAPIQSWVAILNVHMSSVGLHLSFFWPSVFLPISHFLNFSKDRNFIPCFFSFSQLFESVGWIQLLKAQGSRPGQTRWESAGTTESSKPTPLPAGNTHLEPCYSHTACFQSYFTSVSCIHLTHQNPSVSIILMSKFPASRSMKPCSQAENYNLCYSNCAPLLLLPSYFPSSAPSTPHTHNISKQQTESLSRWERTFSIPPRAVSSLKILIQNPWLQSSLG